MVFPIINIPTYPIETIYIFGKERYKTMSLTEKTAYIKGLADGLEYDKTTKEGKILAALLELVDEMAAEITDIREDIEEIDEDLEYLNDYIEEIDDDLEVVENFLDDDYELDEDEDEEEDEDWDDEFCDGDCTACEGCDCEDDEYFEIVCPSCGETVCFDQELDPENLICPACGEKFGCIVDEDDYKKISDEK